MADKDIKESGKEAGKASPEPVKSEVTPPALTPAEIEAKARADADAKAIAEENALVDGAKEYIAKVISPGIAKPTDKFAKAISASDPRDTSIDTSQCWKFTDPEVSNGGRF